MSSAFHIQKPIPKQPCNSTVTNQNHSNPFWSVFSTLEAWGNVAVLHIIFSPPSTSLFLSSSPKPFCFYIFSVNSLLSHLTTTPSIQCFGLCLFFCPFTTVAFCGNCWSHVRWPVILIQQGNLCPKFWHQPSKGVFNFLVMVHYCCFGFEVSGLCHMAYLQVGSTLDICDW